MSSVLELNKQYSLKISALRHVSNVSVNSKPDHPPLAKPLGNFFVGRIPHPWAKKQIQNPHPRAYKNKLNLPPGAFSSIIHNTA